MLIGVNLSHDYAHCILDEGRLTLIEEERHSRRRYHLDASSYTLACLDRYELSELAELDAIVLNSPHTAKIARGDGDLSSASRDYRYVGRYPGAGPDEAIADGRVRVGGVSVPAKWVSHYHAHAMASYWASDFARADVLCLDGGGDFGEGAVFAARNDGIQQISRLIDTQLGSSYHHFALRVYEAETGFFESKVMAIAAYGRPELSESSFLSRRGSLVAIDSSVRPSVHDIAEFQRAFEEGVLTLLSAMDRSSCALCVSGGCFYNVPLNTRIADSGLYQRLYVPPHAGDMGTALGAALLVAHAGGITMPSRSHAASPFLGDDLTVEPNELRRLVVDVGDVPVFHGIDDTYVMPRSMPDPSSQ